LVDGQGSVRSELSGGTVEAVTTYSPYGNLFAQTGDSGTVYGFTGEQYGTAGANVQKGTVFSSERGSIIYLEYLIIYSTKP
jgi:hypothetical protein